MTIDDTGRLVELYRRMLRIRAFEERASVLYKAGEVPGFVHLSIGQEATEVGACAPLTASDGIVSTHRGHGHCIAKGASLYSMFAELMGRVTGACGGLGGSMHIADVEVGIFGANGIVGAGLPIACGVGMSKKLAGEGNVVVSFFGDGAVAQGAFHEAVNLASLWQLPVVFMCENNGFSEMTPTHQQHRAPIVERAAGYGVPGVVVDGNDIVAVASAMDEVVAGVRAGGGPVFVEARTYRVHGHYEGDPLRYRDEDEAARWRARDPLEVARRALLERGASAESLERVAEEVGAECADAEERARQDAAPTIEDARRALYAPRAVDAAEVPLPDAGGEATYRQMDAVHDALERSLAEDPTVWVAGIDVGAAGNVFGVTRGLADANPGRVLDSPISETALVGAGVGAAISGTRPVVEIMYMDFIGVCFDQLMNQAAKIRYMTGGHTDVPLVVRTQFGAGRSSGAQHSQSLEALLAHIPGLTVVMPSTPEDTYGLLRAAIKDPNPVVFVEHRLLYGRKGVKPPADHLVPIGRGVVRRSGEQITVVTWSAMVHVVLEAAERVAADGISCEVLDMRTVAPLDMALIESSVRKTGRVLVAHEAVLSGGVGAEIVARISRDCFWHLDAPPHRVGTEFLPAPYAPSAEREWLTSVDDVVRALRELAAT